MLKRLLEYNPDKRISVGEAVWREMQATEAINHPWFSETLFPQDYRLMPTFPPRKVVKPSRN